MNKKDALVAGVVIVIIAGLGPPLISGSLQPLIVLSGSMQPIMNPGDTVIIRETSPTEIKRGDIIAFDDPSGRSNVLITHRVINVNSNEDNLSFKTKGDASEDPDPFVVSREDVVGRAVFSIPYLGYLFHYGSHPIVLVLLILIPSILIILSEIRKISEYTDPIKIRKKEREDRKSGSRTKRIKINYKKSRLLGILIISFLIFGILSIPTLQKSGENTTARFSGGDLSTTLVYMEEENQIPQYNIISKGENISLENNQMHMVSAAPHIIPTFMVAILAEANPKLPSLFTLLVPPIFLTFLLYPVWRRPSKRGKSKRR